MANEIRGDIVVRGADKAGRDLKGLGDSAAKAGSQVEDLGKDTTAAAKGVTGLGDSASDSAIPLGELGDQAGYVGREIERLTQQTRDLVAELDRTGDQSLLKDISKSQRQTRKLIKIGDLLPDPAELAKAGAGVGMGFIEGASAFIKGSGGPILIGALVAAVVAATPFIGASIGAAVLGGAGGGGIVGGITLAAQDPRVKSAAEAFGKSAMGDLKMDLGLPFVGPTIVALGDLADTVDHVSATLSPAFKSLSTEVGPLVKGLDGLARNAGPGAVKALAAAEPIVRTLANHLPEIGDALGSFLEDVSEGGDGAVMALDGLLDVTEGLITQTGKWISLASKTYEVIANIGLVVGDAADEVGRFDVGLGVMLGFLPMLNDLFGGQAEALAAANEEAPAYAGNVTDIGVAAGTAAEQLEAMQDAIDELFGKVTGVNEATIAYEQSIDDLAKELKEGARSLDMGTEAGRKNWQAINDNVDAIKNLRDANIENGMSVEAADAKYEAQLDTLSKTLAKMGMNTQQVKDYIAAIRGIPTLAQLQVTVSGIEGAKAQLLALKGLLGSSAAAANVRTGANYVSGRASGGPIQAGVPYIVGEEGPELIIPSQSGTVMTAAQTKAMQSGASGGSAVGGGSRQVIELRLSFDPRAHIAGLQAEIVDQGGNVQTVLGDPSLVVTTSA